MSTEYAALMKGDRKAYQKLADLLVEYSEREPEIQGQMILAYPAGVPIASTWKGTVDPILIGAVSAAMRITFDHLCQTLKKGNLTRLFMTSEQGKCIIQNAGPKAILTTMMSFDADVYRIAFIVGDMTMKIERLMASIEEK